ncbi:helix-turn-helix transcriptional regulator [Clostridium botulinum]|uniref:Helix-turn-helix transcriptional regulator n=1 Tax=Clostridium botulinum TaxID=1491 RepID=A0ABD7CLR5_CLOBO|nr:helix-turn-helix transcriptional regulator [Clostridium botulinum]KGO13618.1 XRE family transcriptional regulator [Clostridium botulinum]KIN80018.1 XRE family transcriptional regulator [Clostridium botulinum]NFB54897.1 XRE family transcriptional regulator [Clostridium botulinum]NFB59107.1 XRE family transcriptional regulator [Clostridium botulinum]QRI54234.1 helix-turn-helix transcriptional regulator [Clostridium botulinum]
MTRAEFIKKVDEKVKLIRTEKGYTQDKMAEILGISKKTLVQVEKERGSLGWAVAVAACVIFKDSEVLELTFGGDIEDIIRSLSLQNNEKKYAPTMGGNIWWRNIKHKNGYTIQQNIISNHYRILDSSCRRICCSFELDYIELRLQELSK